MATETCFPWAFASDPDQSSGTLRRAQLRSPKQYSKRSDLEEESWVLRLSKLANDDWFKYLSPVEFGKLECG